MNPDQIRMNIYKELNDERHIQDDTYGGVAHDDEHSPNDWIVLVARYATKAAAYPACSEEMTPDDWTNFRKNMRRAAALAVAAIEYADRQSGIGEKGESA